MIGIEELFLETVNDIINRYNENKKYSTIKACGLLRLLFIDSNPLVHQINKKIREERKKIIKLEFTVCGVGNEELLNKGTRLAWTTPDPIFQRSKNVDFKEFLAFPVLFYFGESYTIKDMILICANVMGGVHAGTKTDDREKKLMEVFNDNKIVEVLDGSFNMGYDTIDAIIRIAVESMRPIISEIKES
ncbi:hypothetical protein [Sphingobacterium sp.]|uniref:hypothetical protein n=1 Tax=Sphingobacterium sp. TaxID=341027 RepID=UPI002FDEED0D